MKYNTGNPVGSADPRDLYDTATVADNLVHGEEPGYTDRLGKKRKSWAGMEKDFDEFLANSGYVGTGTDGAIEDYAPGIEVTAYNQIIRDGGEFWRAAAGTELPYTTTGAGMPEGGAFVSVGDAVLRQDLSGPISSGKGAALVSGASVHVSSVSAGFSGAPVSEGTIYRAVGWHSTSAVERHPKGSGLFVGASSISKSEHNGIDIISPTVPSVADQSGATLEQKAKNFRDGAGETDPGGAGCFVLVIGSYITPYQAGAKGDLSHDDTDAIQDLLYLRGDGNPSSGIEAKQSILHVHFENGGFRITRPVHQPSSVQVTGEAVPLSNIRRGWDFDLTDSCVIYADFETPLQSAWIISGYSRNGTYGLTDGDLVDPYIHGPSDTDYLNGNITRTYKNKLIGLDFYTDKFVASAVSFAAAPDINIHIGCYGFLHNVCGYISFGATIELYGLSYHSGFFAWSPNGCNLTGYINRMDTPVSPYTVAEGIPALWSEDNITSYSDDVRYWTTGAWLGFAHAWSIESLTAEGWQRGRLFWNCEGISETAPYSEALSETAFHNINSSGVVSAPFFFDVTSLTRSGGGNSGTLVLDNIKGGSDPVASVNQVSGTAPVIVARFQQQSDVAASEVYSDSVKFEFFKGGPLSIYVDPTYGDNTKAGLNMPNAVQTFDQAIVRAEQYKADQIIIAEGQNALNTAEVSVSRKLKVLPETGAATVQWLAEGGVTIRPVVLEDGADLQFVNVNWEIAGTSSGTTFRGAFRPAGQCNVSAASANINAGTDGFLFVSGTNTAATLRLRLQSCSVNTDSFGSNQFDSSGDVIVLYSKSADTTVPSAEVWGSDFRVL